MPQAARIERFGTSPAYDGTTQKVNGHYVWTGKLALSSMAQQRKPLTIREPSMIFVNSMSDFFHPNAKDEWRAGALKIVEATPWHKYQILTKRPEEIRPFQKRAYRATFPPNVWLGVTVERGDFAHRIDTLRKVNCDVRFISFEPLIGALGDINLAEISWAIIGGESGPGARPMRAEWARAARDLCLRHGVPIFFKQWGVPKNNPLWQSAPLGVDPAEWVERNDPIGKGGSLLDGREWKEYPCSVNTSAGELTLSMQ
jgi:protein gp37